MDVWIAEKDRGKKAWTAAVYTHAGTMTNFYKWSNHVNDSVKQHEEKSKKKTLERRIEHKIYTEKGAENANKSKRTTRRIGF